MARGDMKYSSGRSRGGSGSSYAYDDEGRGRSQNYYEAFERMWERVGFSKSWLLTRITSGDSSTRSTDKGMSDEFVYNLVHNTTTRYNIHDWATYRFEDPQGNDGRSRRLVIKHHDEKTWRQFQERAKIAYEATTKKREEQRMARAEEDAARRAAFEAERIKREHELTKRISKQVELTAGAIQSDFNTAFTQEPTYGLQEGSWLDDPVAAATSRDGFAQEDEKATGIKLQITLSLDCSNSMYYNKVDGEPMYEAAAETFRDLYLALEKMKEQFPNDLFIGAFEFSNDTYEERKMTDAWGHRKWERAERLGRGVTCLSHKQRGWGMAKDFTGDVVENNWLAGEGDGMGAVNKYREPKSWHFQGQDTWLYPLFETLEDWEKKFSDPGAVRLDLIITDAVLEHPSDIRRSDEVQERRDGALNTVLLNLLPEKEWVNSDLPLRCVQYPARRDNIGGMLRTLISNFIQAYV